MLNEQIAHDQIINEFIYEFKSDPDREINYGCNYEYGIGVEKNEKNAFELYLKSEDGNSNGQNNLGRCYEKGIGTAKDEKKAFEWYLKSAEDGNSDGQNNLGRCYENGTGTAKDEKKAFELYLKSAKDDNSDGQNNLGRCYENGIGTAKNEKKVFEWYFKSAEGGNPDSQFNLGLCYGKGKGTTKDKKKELEWYLESAKNGRSVAIYNVGWCYRNGSLTKKNKDKAFKYYKKYHDMEFTSEVDDKIIEVDIEGLYVRCPSYLPYFEGWSPGTLFNIFMKNDNHLFVNLRNDPIAKIINSIIPYTFLLILIILSPLAALVFYFYFIAFKLKQILFQSLTSTAIATLTFFITTSINTNNASFEKFKFASYLLYLGIVAQFLISKELTYLLLSFLSSYSLLVYGTVFLGVTNVKSLYEQHHIYLSLLFISTIFSQLINILFCTTLIYFLEVYFIELKFLTKLQLTFLVFLNILLLYLFLVVYLFVNQKW